MHTYTVTATSADALTATATIHYTVTAASIPTPVAAPVVDGCPAATGQLKGSTLGLLKLGMTRAQAISQYAESSSNNKPTWQFFCLTPRIVRAGFPSPQLLKTLTAKERTRVADRILIALTASYYYNLKGVHSGTSLSVAAKKLHTGPVFEVGKNDWYMAPNGHTTAIIKVRQGKVQEIGTATKSLTRTRTQQRTFITSFS